MGNNSPGKSTRAGMGYYSDSLLIKLKLSSIAIATDLSFCILGNTGKHDCESFFLPVHSTG
jgi:hypothetical protein